MSALRWFVSADHARAFLAVGFASGDIHLWSSLAFVEPQNAYVRERERESVCVCVCVCMYVCSFVDSFALTPLYISLFFFVIGLLLFLSFISSLSPFFPPPLPCLGCTR